MSMSRLVPRKRLVAMLVVGLVLLLAVLLNLPLKNLVENLADDTLVGTLSAHKKLTAAIIGITGLAVASWLIYVRSFRLLGAGVLATVVLGLTYGVYKFQSAYPLADVFSVERYEDNLSILLGKDIALSKYDPHSGLVQQPRLVDRAAFPAIDVHFHLESLPPDISPERLIRGMDDAGISAIVNLGGLPGMFEQLAATFHDKYPDRFIMFVKPDPDALERENGIAEQLDWLKKAAGMGARGLKENKSFGLGQRDASGKLDRDRRPAAGRVWDLAAAARYAGTRSHWRTRILLETGRPVTTSAMESSWSIRSGVSTATVSSQLRGAHGAARTADRAATRDELHRRALRHESRRSRVMRATYSTSTRTTTWTCPPWYRARPPAVFGTSCSSFDIRIAFSSAPTAAIRLESQRWLDTGAHVPQLHRVSRNRQRVHRVPTPVDHQAGYVARVRHRSAARRAREGLRDATPSA